MGLKLTGILKGSASVSFSDGERDSGRACKHACVQVCVCDPGELWTNEGNGITVGGKHQNQPESYVQGQTTGWSWDLLASPPPESTSQRPGEHQVSYACSMLCQGL